MNPGEEWVPTDDMLIAFDQGLANEADIDAIGRWLMNAPGAEERLRQLTEQRTDAAAEALRQHCTLEGELADLSDVTNRVVLRVTNARDSNTDTQTPLGIIREYQLTKELGRGGMGRVFQARHLRLQRNVAVKLLAPELASDSTYRRRFEREMAVLGQLDHPNLVRAADAGVEGDKLFLVMELLEGRDLKTLVAVRGELRVADACEVTRQAALGLHHAHQAGMVHRDVKPGNLFLTAGGVVKVIDLGVARVTGPNLTDKEVSTIRTVLGTPDFMAPEQWGSTAVDCRADIYSLGCTLYFLLTGRPPFQVSGNDIWLSLLEAHRRVTPPSILEQRRDVLPELDQLIKRMMAKAPERRLRDAQEVAAALAPFTNRHDLPALLNLGELAAGKREPPSALPTSRIKTRRHLSVWIAASCVAAAVLAAAIWQMLPTAADHGSTGYRWLNSPSSSVAEVKYPLDLKPARKLDPLPGGITALAFSPDGKLLASGGQDRAIHLWNTTSWTTRGPLGKYAGDVVNLAFSPDGSRLATVTSASDTSPIRIWDIRSGQVDKVLGQRAAGMWGLAYSPDGETLACGGYDSALRLFDVASGEERLVIPKVATRHVRALSFSLDGKIIATGGSGPTRLWDPTTGNEIPSQLPEEFCPAFLPPLGKELAGWDFRAGRVAICAVPSGKVREARRAHDGVIEGFAISSDGRFIATFGNDGFAHIWSTADLSKVATMQGHRGGLYAAAFTPDGARLATGGIDDCTILIWDLPAICRVKK